MGTLFNTPDEYLQGFFKSGPSMLEAFTGLGSAAQPPTQATTALGRSLASYYEKQAALWTGTLSAGTGTGKAQQPVVDAERGDRRFHGEHGATTRGTACSSRPTCSTRGCSTTWSRRPSSTRRTSTSCASSRASSSTR